MRKKYSFLIIFTCLMIATSIPIMSNGDGEKSSNDLPKAEREFRAAWIATVANINWPSEPGLNTEEQQKEAIALLDLLKENNFNAAIFQVRPQCDALYKSELEPWSYYLTGIQGEAPEPFYDPLEFWIEEAHKRGIELHVWLNPYRAHHFKGGEVSEHSIVKKKPELVLELSSGYYWLDPSLKETREHSLAVVMDIVKRYDIDGVHFDDYFYPYPSYHDGDFPDDKSWEKYLADGGKLNKKDWRRESVNIFIKDLYKEIKKEKSYVKFGLSPFGIWRPNNPHSIKGFDQYDKLYADAKLWLNEGWIDYFTPQLYWAISKIPQSFPVLLNWWESENTKGRHLWPGINLSLNNKNSMEGVNQIMVSRGILPKSPGVVHWSIGGVLDEEFQEKLKKGVYKNQALVPSSPWLDNEAPAAPSVSTEMEEDILKISWEAKDSDDNFLTVVYYKYADEWKYQIVNNSETSLAVPMIELDYSELKGKEKADITNIDEIVKVLKSVAVSTVDRSGNESELKVQQIPADSNIKIPTIDEIFMKYEELNGDKN